jgi:hypothetical protein
MDCKFSISFIELDMADQGRWFGRYIGRTSAMVAYLANDGWVANRIESRHKEAFNILKLRCLNSVATGNLERSRDNNANHKTSSRPDNCASEGCTGVYDERR